MTRNFRTLEDKGRGANAISVSYLLGTVENSSILKFQKLLFRMSRGTTFTSFDRIDTSFLRSSSNKTYFDGRSAVLIVFQFGSDKMYGNKLVAACKAYDMQFHEYLNPAQEASKMKMSRMTEHIDEIRKVPAAYQTIDETKNCIDRLVHKLTDAETCFGVSYVEHLRLSAVKELSIIQMYSRLHEQGPQLLSGTFWVCEGKTKELKDLIERLQSQKKENNSFHGVVVERLSATKHQPTHFYSNEVLEPFQTIVNTYGIPRYKEINPAPFIVSSFPFLFGVMFGDIGHGVLLLVGTLFLFNLDAGRGAPASGITRNKYLFLAMSLFSIYCGFMYNDMLALPTTLVKTCYHEVLRNGKPAADRKIECTPPYGIDPFWGKAKNEITYLNSFKMKMSIIIGVLQMLFGLLLKGCNALYFKEWIVFFFEFLPQLLFLACSFGYMVVCIVLKWLTSWEQAAKPPMIINTFINFVSSVDTPLFENREKQLALQRLLASSPG